MVNAAEVHNAAPVDWRCVVEVLAEMAPHPLLVIGRDGRIRAIWATASEALGWPPKELDGADATSTLAPPGEGDAMRARLQEALAGRRARDDFEVVSRAGVRLHVTVAITAVGGDADRCLVIAILSVREVSAGNRWRAQGELTYEVSLKPSEQGRLTRQPEGEQRVFGATGELCYDRIYGFSAPCVDCPVRRGANDPWPRVAVRRAPHSNVYHLIRAHQVAPDVALVTVNMLPETSVAALNEAKIRHLADQAGLTERERGVLGCLLLGRSLDEIAEMLGISARTVKFHQQNVLNKLGADSRVDLIRLIL